MTNRSIWRGHRFGLLVAAFALFPSNGSGTAVVASSRGPVVPGSGDRVFSQTRAGGLDVGRLRGNDAEAAVPNRYRLTLTGTMHVQSVEALNCDPGIARTTIEDSTVRIRTAGAIPVWVSTGGSVPPPPPLYRGRNFPGIYGFGHSAYMVLAVSTSVVTRVGTCGRPAREGRCAVTGTTLGRLESPRSPARRMYLVEDSISIRNGTCHADAHSTFLEDLFRRPAFANVPLTAIVRGRPRRFGVHLHQQRRDGDVTNTLDLSWRADIAPADAVVAVPSASTAVRGGRVTLDGSRSFSRIQTYSWKVARGGDCPPEVKVSPELLTGKRVSFPALCSFKARLTVDNEHASDSKTIAVRVEPRPWKTPFSVAREGKLETRLVDGLLQFGRNVCAFDGLKGEQTSGHMLHRAGVDGAYAAKGGFTVAEITTGPFRGNFYVAAYRTKVRRASLISRDLFEGSELYAANAPNEKLQLPGHVADLQALRSSVRDHEQLHSTLIQKALERDDRARTIEKLVGPDRGPLEKDVSDELVGLETALTEATSDDKVKALMRARWSRPATILIRDGSGGFIERTFPSLAEIGDQRPQS